MLLTWPCFTSNVKSCSCVSGKCTAISGAWFAGDCFSNEPLMKYYSLRTSREFRRELMSTVKNHRMKQLCPKCNIFFFFFEDLLKMQYLTNGLFVLVPFSHNGCHFFLVSMQFLPFLSFSFLFLGNSREVLQKAIIWSLLMAMKLHFLKMLWVLVPQQGIISLWDRGSSLSSTLRNMRLQPFWGWFFKIILSKISIHFIIRELLLFRTATANQFTRGRFAYARTPSKGV